MSSARRRIGLATIGVLVLVAAAPLIALGFGVGEWNGHIKGDPDSFIAFQVRKNDEGVKRVRDVGAGDLAFDCESGNPGNTSGVSFDGRFRVRDGKFGGKTDATITGFDPPAKITGKFKPDKRAVGTVRIHGELDPKGQPGVDDCDTGVLRWRAKKGPPNKP